MLQIAIAQQGYDLLDRVIRELDHRIAMFDAAVDSNDSGTSDPKAQDSSFQTSYPPPFRQPSNGVKNTSAPGSVANPTARNGMCAQSSIPPNGEVPGMFGCHTLPSPAFSLLR